MPVTLTRHLINAVQRSPLPVTYRGRILLLRSPVFVLGTERFDLEIVEGEAVLGYIGLGEDAEFAVLSARNVRGVPVTVRTLEDALEEVAH